MPPPPLPRGVTPRGLLYQVSFNSSVSNIVLGHDCGFLHVFVLFVLLDCFCFISLVVVCSLRLFVFIFVFVCLFVFCFFCLVLLYFNVAKTAR